jgi:hypothetical protein
VSGDVSKRLARAETMAGIKSFYKLSKIANFVQEMPGPTGNARLLLALRPMGWPERRSITPRASPWSHGSLSHETIKSSRRQHCRAEL